MPSLVRDSESKPFKAKADGSTMETNIWVRASLDPRPRWSRDWPLLLLVPGAIVFTGFLWRQTGLSFVEALCIALAAAGAATIGMSVYRVVIGTRYQSVRELHPGAIVFEATRSAESVLALGRLITTRVKPTFWSIVAIDGTGLHWYLRDPANSECVFVPSANIASICAGTASVKDGYGRRKVPAVVVNLVEPETMSLPLVARSERWDATFRYSANRTDLELLCAAVRDRIETPANHHKR